MSLQNWYRSKKKKKTFTLQWLRAKTYKVLLSFVCALRVLRLKSSLVHPTCYFLIPILSLFEKCSLESICLIHLREMSQFSQKIPAVPNVLIQHTGPYSQKLCTHEHRFECTEWHMNGIISDSWNWWTALKWEVIKAQTMNPLQMCVCVWGRKRSHSLVS